MEMVGAMRWPEPRGFFAAAAGYGEADVLWCTTPLAHLYCFGAGVLGGLLNGATVLLGKGMLTGSLIQRAEHLFQGRLSY